MLIAAIIFLLIGALFAGIGLLLRRSVARFETTAERAVGTVTGVKTYEDRYDGRSAFPVVRYVLPDGQEIETEVRTQSDEEEIGSSVDLLYDPEDPWGRVDLAGPGDRAAAGVFMGLGGLLITIGVILAILSAL